MRFNVNKCGGCGVHHADGDPCKTCGTHHRPHCNGGLLNAAEVEQAERRCKCDFNTVIMVTGCKCGGE